MYSISTMPTVILINALFKTEFQVDIHTLGPMNISHIEWNLISHLGETSPAECGHRLQACSALPARREAFLGDGSEHTPAQVTSGCWGQRKKHMSSTFSLETRGVRQIASILRGSIYLLLPPDLRISELF